MYEAGKPLFALAVLCLSASTQASLFGGRSHASPPFNIDHVTSLFSQALQSDGQGNTVVLLDNYVAAYTELTRVFDIFGFVFSFARDDILSDLASLNDLRSVDQTNYVTFESMFAYEYSEYALHLGQPGVSKNRAIHRALRFISHVLNEIKQEDDGDLAGRVRALYDEILAPHHNWFARVAARLAINSFPSRDRFLNGVHLNDDDEGMASLTMMIAVLDQVYNHVQGLYDQYSE